MTRDTNLLMAILAHEPVAYEPLDGWDKGIFERHCDLLTEAGYLKRTGYDLVHTSAGRDLRWLLGTTLDYINPKPPNEFWAAIPLSVLESLCRRIVEQRLLGYEFRYLKTPMPPIQFPTPADAGTTEKG